MTRRAAWSGAVAGVALTVVHGAAAVAAPPPGERVDRTVVEVLSDPDFAGLRDGPIERLRERAIAFILDQLGSLFGGAGTSAVGLVILGVAVLVLGLVARRILARRVVAPATAGSGVEVRVSRSAGAWWADARRARAEGELAEAARLGYRAVVAALDARGLVEDVDGRTVGEHRRRLAESGDAVTTLAGFDAAADVFERSWYGGEDVGDEDLAVVDDAARRIGVEGA